MSAILVGTAAKGSTAATAGLFGTAGAVTTAGVTSAGAIGLGVAGQTQQGRAVRADAQSQQNIANFNAQVQKREAAAKRQAAKFASKRQAEETARRKGSLEARLAAAGGLGSPVAADLVAELASEQDLENLIIGFEGEVAATRAESQAELDIVSGKAAKQRGRAKRTGAFVKAGTTLLKGFS